MNTTSLQQIIEAAFEARAEISPGKIPPGVAEAIETSIGLLDSGALRVAEKRDGEWRIVLRRLVYEKDRLDPVDPNARLELDAKLLAEFPVGYRHLAYLQTRIGYKVKKDMAGLVGPDVDKLYALGKEWLEGKPCL